MSEVVNLVNALGLPINGAALIVALWLIDRRLVRIETKLGIIEKEERA